MKAELFNIEDKKDDQRKAEMAMSPSERLILCLELMDLYKTLNPDKQPEYQQDVEDIQWIEVFVKKDDK